MRSVVVGVEAFPQRRGAPAGAGRSSWCLATPQSMTRTSPKDPTITFSGFRSRWMTPWAWAKATASQMRRKSRSRSPSSGPSRTWASSLFPDTSFIA